MNAGEVFQLAELGNVASEIRDQYGDSVDEVAVATVDRLLETSPLEPRLLGVAVYTGVYIGWVLRQAVNE